MRLIVIILKILIRALLKKDKNALSAATATVTVSGSGMASATSDVFYFGGSFLAPPAGGVLQMKTTDNNGAPVPLHVSIDSYTQDDHNCYNGAKIRVFSLQDVGSYTATIKMFFVGRGFRATSS